MYCLPTDEHIRSLLQQARNIVVVGLSDKTHRDSNRVAKYLQEHGYRIIPVNPGLKTILGEKCYPDLLSIPEPVDIINVFRRSELVLPVVRDALHLNPQAIWLQLGIMNEGAADLANSAGVSIIMDKCIKVEHSRLLGSCGIPLNSLN